MPSAHHCDCGARIILAATAGRRQALDWVPDPQGTAAAYQDALGTWRVRRCASVAHLEVVTSAENTRRGMAGLHQKRKTHCPAGHPYDEVNTIVRYNGARRCRTCHQQSERARYATRIDPGRNQ